MSTYLIYKKKISRQKNPLSCAFISENNTFLTLYPTTDFKIKFIIRLFLYSLKVFLLFYKSHSGTVFELPDHLRSIIIYSFKISYFFLQKLKQKFMIRKLTKEIKY